MKCPVTLLASDFLKHLSTRHCRPSFIALPGQISETEGRHILFTKSNGAGKEVEARVAKSPGLSPFRKEEPVDGDSDKSYALHSYRSSATRLIGKSETCYTFPSEKP